MSEDGERNYLPIVAIVIVVIFALAAAAGVVVWRRQQLMDSQARGPSMVATETTATVAATTATATAIPTEVVHARPRGSVSLAPDPTPIPNAERTVARLRPGFRFCYNKGLAMDPSLEGSITVAITVAPSGDVTNVTKKSGTGLNADVESCILKRARLATFDATPSGGTVDVPVQFVRAP